MSADHWPAGGIQLVAGVQPPGFAPVTEEVLAEVVRRVVAVLQPYKVILLVPLLYGATFHAQQCAEKYLKALLVVHSQTFPRTHDLAALSDLCLQQGLVIPVHQDALERLAAYAVQVRYPGEDPTLDEAREACQIAQAVRRFARKLLKSLP